MLRTFAILLVAVPLTAGELRIEHEISIAAPIEDVWNVWTSEEGAATFFSENTNIDLRPGGPYEILFDMSKPEGLRGCEGCRILAYDPPHMLSFTWNAPPKFGELRSHQTHVTIRLAEEGPNLTKLHFVQEGFGESPTWREIHAYFVAAWGNHVLPRLVESFQKK